MENKNKKKCPKCGSDKISKQKGNIKAFSCMDGNKSLSNLPYVLEYKCENCKKTF